MTTSTTTTTTSTAHNDHVFSTLNRALSGLQAGATLKSIKTSFNFSSEAGLNKPETELLIKQRTKANFKLTVESIIDKHVVMVGKIEEDKISAAKEDARAERQAVIESDKEAQDTGSRLSVAAIIFRLSEGFFVEITKNQAINLLELAARKIRKGDTSAPWADIALIAANTVAGCYTNKEA